MHKVYELIGTIQDECLKITETAGMVDFPGCDVIEAIWRIQAASQEAEAAYHKDK